MRILLLDIELAPNLATVWSIWNQNIGLTQLHDTSRMLSYSAKWHTADTYFFGSEWTNGRDEMLSSLHSLLNEADAVVHYNGKRFDMPHINREFLEAGFLPPNPYHQVDLMLVVKKTFRFVSNKLDHVLTELGLTNKMFHEGHELWLKCMGFGDYTDKQRKDARKVMEEYNIQDVYSLEELYNKLLPWIKSHPNHALYVDHDRPVCPNCGSDHIIKNGVETTKLMAYQRYRCKSCGTPIRGRNTVLPLNKRKLILTQSKL